MTISRLSIVAPLLTFAVAATFAQSNNAPSNARPESGFVSQGKYTNSFFGFSFQLPQDQKVNALVLPARDRTHFLFGFQAQQKGLTILSITATEGAASSDDAKKAAIGAKGQTAKPIDIGGRKFWKSESQEKSHVGKMQNINFATASNGYIIEIKILSFDHNFSAELQRDVEAMTFFDPATAGQKAGQDSSPPGLVPSDPASKPPSTTTHPIDQDAQGVISGNVYKSEALGFTYKFPASWVVADKRTQQQVTEAGHEAAWGNSASTAREHEAVQQCTRNLLWVTKYPEGTRPDEVNSLVVVVLMDPTCMPGARFPSSADDREGIQQLVDQFTGGFQGTPFFSKDRSSAKTSTLQGHLILDISGSSVIDMPGRKNLRSNIYTSFVFTQLKKYWIAWLLMSGNESDLQDLKAGKISFISGY